MNLIESAKQESRTFCFFVFYNVAFSLHHLKLKWSSSVCFHSINNISSYKIHNRTRSFLLCISPSLSNNTLVYLLSQKLCFSQLQNYVVCFYNESQDEAEDEQFVSLNFPCLVHEFNCMSIYLLQWPFFCWNIDLKFKWKFDVILR